MSSGEDGACAMNGTNRDNGARLMLQLPVITVVTPCSSLGGRSCGRLRCRRCDCC